MKAQFLTDRGQVRGHNEDSGGIYFNASDQLLAIIADGMGGHQAGDIASQMAVEIIQEKWQQCKEFTSPEQTEKWLEETLSEMNNHIYDCANQKEEYTGMGTTIVVSVITDDFITIAHIGDSRCYINNQAGFKQITEDHSLVNELVRTGQITKEDAQHHPRKNIVLRALGTEETVSIDIQSVSLEFNDTLLLCSDGLTDKVTNEELAELIQLNSDIKEIGKNMVDLANERGGEDNISLIIIYRDSKEEGESSC